MSLWAPEEKELPGDVHRTSSRTCFVSWYPRAPVFFSASIRPLPADTPVWACHLPLQWHAGRAAEGEGSGRLRHSWKNFSCHCSGTKIRDADTDVHMTLSSKFMLNSSGTTETRHTGVCVLGCIFRALNMSKCRHSSQKRVQSGPGSLRQQLTSHTHCNGYTRVRTGEAQSKSKDRDMSTHVSLPVCTCFCVVYAQLNKAIHPTEQNKVPTRRRQHMIPEVPCT